MRPRPALSHTFLAGLIALPVFLGSAGWAVAAPLSVPYEVEAGDTFSYVVRYLRTALVGGQPNPVVSIDYDLEMEITATDRTTISATVRNTGMNITVDGQRVLSPPDFDSLIFLTIDGLSAELELANDGALIRIANWESLRDEMVDRAKELAGEDPGMITTLETFLPSVGPADAVQFFARPLAISAPGRIVTFNPPEQTSATAENVELPSFATYADGSWSFDLIPRDDIADSITVEWLGVPSPEGLRSILAPIGDQMAKSSSLTEEEWAEIENSSRMWQRFAATYDDEDGQLLEFQGLMELHAGDLIRRVAIEARAKGR